MSDKIPIGIEFPSIIVAEITDALLLPIDRILKRAVRFVEAGAKFVDIGTQIGEEHPEKLGRIISAVRDRLEPLHALVSVDSISPSEIEAGVEAGASLVFSIDGRNMDLVASSCREIGVVVLPTDKSTNLPLDASKRAQQLSCNISEARHLGYKKIIGDLILESMISPGLFNSMLAYSEFRKEHPEIPLCMGIGNVTEFADFDSVGINGTIASLGVELNINLFLTTEASTKTRNTIFETVQCTKMAYYAKHRNMPPKDLGFDLLISKSKRRKNIELLNSKPDEEITVPKKQGLVKRDKTGFFRIYLNYENKLLHIEFYLKSGQLIHHFKGKRARDLYLEIVERNLVGDYNHACYLGSELKKAEICLVLGKEYYQDGELFVLD